MSGMFIKIQGKKTNINKFRNNLKNILFINTILTIVILIINQCLVAFYQGINENSLKYIVCNIFIK